jgi:hypothetical protein
MKGTEMDDFDRDCWAADRKWWRYEWERRRAAEQRNRELLDLLRRVVNESGAMGNLTATRAAKRMLEQFK